jgi:hypothetical protein
MRCSFVKANHKEMHRAGIEPATPDSCAVLSNETAYWAVHQTSVPRKTSKVLGRSEIFNYLVANYPKFEQGKRHDYENNHA